MVFSLLIFCSVVEFWEFFKYSGYKFIIKHITWKHLFLVYALKYFLTGWLKDQKFLHLIKSSRSNCLLWLTFLCNISELCSTVTIPPFLLEVLYFYSYVYSPFRVKFCIGYKESRFFSVILADKYITFQ